MAAHTVRVLFLLSAMIVWLVCTLCTFYLRRCEQQQLVPSPARRSSSRASNALPNDLCVDRASEGIDCLQQALWGKCSEPFLRGCNASCGRCVSEARQRSLHSTLLVSARQSQPCAEHGADAWVMRAMQNHAEYARANGMALVWSGALIDAAYDGAWNKLTYLLRVLRAELSSDDRPPEERARWLLWADWDVVFTDMAFELPLEEYERRGVRLVLGGDPAAVGGGRPKADYLKANTGVVLLRVHNWSNALLNRMLTRGGRTRAQRRRHALEVQAAVDNLCVGCIDDQAVLLELLHTEPARWARHVHLERRYLMQGHWEDFQRAMPDDMDGLPRHAPPTPLRRLGSPMLPSLRHKVWGLADVPLAVHFSGCQLCSGKAPDKAAPCWPVFRRVVRFAEAQALRALGVHHARGSNRSALNDTALEPLALSDS